MASEFTRFVFLLDAKDEKPVSDTLIQGHISFIRDLDKQGKLVMSGPFTNCTGGMIIIKAADLEEAIEISKKDPFVSTGARSVDVRVWELSCEENNHMGRG